MTRTPAPAAIDRTSAPLRGAARSREAGPLDRELVDFQAEIHRLAVALLEQALAAELARFRAALPSPADLAAAAAGLRAARPRR